MSIEKLFTWVDDNQDRLIENLQVLLRQPSIASTNTGIDECSKLMKKTMEDAGITTTIYPTEGSPVLIGNVKGRDSKTILVYGHYDVQPPDPVELWQTPPFEPTVKDGRVYCRGAQDDKGQMFAFLCGVRELAAGGWKGPTVKFVLDGQEESGSGTLFRLLEDREFRRRIAADVMLVSDTGAAAELRLLRDTGNALCDPLTGEGVPVLEEDAVSPLSVPDAAFAALRVGTVGGGGTLRAFRCDDLRVDGRSLGARLVALTPERFGGAYQGLWFAEETEEGRQNAAQLVG